MKSEKKPPVPPFRKPPSAAAPRPPPPSVDYLPFKNLHDSALQGFKNMIISLSLGNLDDYTRSACELALRIIVFPSHRIKALTILEHYCSLISASAYLFHIRGMVHAYLASQIQDTRVKLKHLKTSLDSVRQAISALPETFKFVESYAKLYSKIIALTSVEDSISLAVIENLRGEIQALEQKMSKMKEIEAASLLQQKLMEFESTSSSSRKKEELKKEHVKKICSFVDRVEKVTSYWKRMGVDAKQRLVRARIEDLIVYLEKKSASKLFSEAVEWAKANKSWKFWSCCSCYKKFSDWESYLEHILQRHIDVWNPEIPYVVPEEVDRKWVEMLSNAVWKPVDSMVALEKMQKQSNLLDSASTSKQILEEHKDDDDRAKILEGIQRMFKFFIESKILSADLLQRMVLFTMKKLKCIIPKSKLMAHSMHTTPLCICLLQLRELKKILHFLKVVAELSESSLISEEDSLINDRAFEIKEQIEFSSDLSSLVLDQRLLSGELSPTKYHTAIANDGSVEIPGIESNSSHEVDSFPETDTFIYWLFSEPSTIQEQVTSWMTLMGKRKREGIQLVQTYQMEDASLRDNCQYKDLYPKFMEFLDIRTDLWLERLEESEWESLLNRVQEKLAQSHDNQIVCKSLEILQCTFPSGTRFSHQYIRNLLMTASLEISVGDTQIVQCLAKKHELELKLKRVSSYDYRSILLTMMKSFARAQLEALIDKDESEKSKAGLNPR